jgi:hypothetical protein
MLGHNTMRATTHPHQPSQKAWVCINNRPNLWAIFGRSLAVGNNIQHNKKKKQEDK